MAPEPKLLTQPEKLSNESHSSENILQPKESTINENERELLKSLLEREAKRKKRGGLSK